MFNQNTSSDTKIAVLEERLSSYEIMMRKIDEAIQIMGKTSQSISKMLAVHEEKLDQCHRTDDFITRTLDELRDENREQHEITSARIDKIEVEIKEIGKIKWMIMGMGMIITIAITATAQLAGGILTPHQIPPTIERAK